MFRHTGYNGGGFQAPRTTRAARRGAAILAALVALALAAPASSSADSLDYTCTPPVPAAPDNCALWHTTPVTLNWIFDAGLLQPLAGSACGSKEFADDTAGAEVTCIVKGLLTQAISKTATVRVDMTPPAVSAPVPDRPPDHNGWYNHAVTFAFGGTDATSGIASCDVVPYTGPEGPSGHVTGGCHDVAGNSATGVSAIKYDATPPTVTALPQASSKDNEVTLKWTASPDTTESTVTRSPGRDGGPQPSTMYSGPAQTFTDTAIAKSTVYTYTITAVDAAANAASTALLVVPGGTQTVVGATQSIPKVPSVTDPATVTGRIVASPPRLRWRKVRGADYYNVQLYRGRRKILSAWPAGTTLQLRQAWTFRGRRFHMTPGGYHWYVWGGFGSRRAHHYGKLISHKRFFVKKRS